MELLVVGSIAYDSIETPAGKVDKVLGGSASYFSVCASLFTRVRLIGVVGEDFSDEYRNLFISRGINTEGLETAPGKTFHWKGDYLDNLNEARTHETCLNVFENFHPRIPPHASNPSHVFLANIDPALQNEILNQVGASAFIACDTMNYWIENKLEKLKNVLKQVTLLFVNDAEVKLLSGHGNVLHSGKEILSWGPQYIIVKRGEYGAFLLGKDECFIIPAYPVENVVDPTGAGDSFAGGFMGYLSKIGGVTGPELRKALVYGAVMASFTVEDFSLNRLKKLDIKDVEKRYENFMSMINLES